MRIVDVALLYSRRRRPVFPVDGKIPRTKHGVKDATTDYATIVNWWTRWPEAGIGLPMGDGLIALDVDGDEGRASLAALEAEHGELPRTLANQTARGRHLIFRVPADRRLGNRAAVRPGLDVRGEGGYIVAPPSRHPTGYIYRWRLAAIAPAPSWLLDVIDPPRPAPAQVPLPKTTPIQGRAAKWAQTILERECAEVAATPEGGRNDRLNRAAFRVGQLIGGGLLDAGVVTELAAAGRACGLGDREVNTILRAGGALDEGAREPVTGPADERPRPDNPALRVVPPSPDIEPPQPAAPPLAAEAALLDWATPLPPVLPTGMDPLDKLLGGGLRAESVHIVNGGTGAGKTALAIGWTLEWAQHGPVVYVSTELSRRQVLARCVGRRLHVPWLKIFEQGPSEAENIASALRGLKLRVVELTPDVRLSATLDAIADAEGMAPVVVLDYLQDAARRVRPDDLYSATAFFADSLRAWTTRNRTVLLALSAVGRGFYEAGGREGVALVGSAKNAGEVEYNGAAVLHLETDPCPLGGSAPAKLHVAKARFGAGGGVVGLTFRGAVGVFELDAMASLNEEQSAVLDAIRRGASSVEDVAQLLKMRAQNARRIVDTLAHRGLIERHRGQPIRIVEQACA